MNTLDHLRVLLEPERGGAPLRFTPEREARRRGLEFAREHGDRQSECEIEIFLRRLLDQESING